MPSTEKPALPYTALLDFFGIFFEDKILNCEVYKLECMNLFSSVDVAIFCHDRKRDTVEV